MSIPKLVNFPIFFRFQESKKKYVNTKINQFAPCFKFQRKHINTKINQFSHFFKFQEQKKYINTKTNQFLSFFGFQELKKKHINIKIAKTNQWVS